MHTNVLIADDDPAFRCILEMKLQEWGYDVSVATDGNEAWNILRRANAPRMAIIDWRMPGLTGPEICRLVRQESHVDYVYIILLTGMKAKENLMEGIEAGADEYLRKPDNFDELDELRIRLRAARRILDLQNELVASNELYKTMATHDSLTGLWNRPASIEALKREINRAARKNISICAAVADLDHFKKVNDTFGHAAGDAVLRGAAKLMGDAVRKYDIVGRYGGEEFLIVLAECDDPPAAAIIERIRNAIASTPLEVLDASENGNSSPMRRLMNITVSIGLAVCPNPKDVTADEIINVADQAMYRAKNYGRNRIEVMYVGQPTM